MCIGQQNKDHLDTIRTLFLAVPEPGKIGQVCRCAFKSQSCMILQHYTNLNIEQIFAILEKPFFYLLLVVTQQIKTPVQMLQFNLIVEQSGIEPIQQTVKKPELGNRFLEPGCYHRKHSPFKIKLKANMTLGDAGKNGPYPKFFI